MIYKIIFLIKCKSNFKVVLIFIFQKIKNIFLKKKIKFYKRDHQKLLSNYKFHYDWFSSDSYFFKKFIKKLPTKFNYLEIGSYEGNSAIFIASNYPNSSIICVDPWKSYEEKKENFRAIENRFDHNIEDFKNIKKIKNTSDNFFFSNKMQFDLIYIDGFHKYDFVLKDCLNSLACLKKNGILICDDYVSQAWSDIKLNPCYAINKFIKDKKKQIKILTVTNSKIFLKKL